MDGGFWQWTCLPSLWQLLLVTRGPQCQTYISSLSLVGPLVSLPFAGLTLLYFLHFLPHSFSPLALAGQTLLPNLLTDLN